MSKHEMADAATEAVRGLIRAFGPKVFVTGINNACVHGEVFFESGGELDDDDVTLGKWYKGVELMSEAAKEMGI